MYQSPELTEYSFGSALVVFVDFFRERERSVFPGSYLLDQSLIFKLLFLKFSELSLVTSQHWFLDIQVFSC